MFWVCGIDELCIGVCVFNLYVGELGKFGCYEIDFIVLVIVEL